MYNNFNIVNNNSKITQARASLSLLRKTHGLSPNKFGRWQLKFQQNTNLACCWTFRFWWTFGKNKTQRNVTKVFKFQEPFKNANCKQQNHLVCTKKISIQSPKSQFKKLKHMHITQQVKWMDIGSSFKPICISTVVHCFWKLQHWAFIHYNIILLLFITSVAHSLFHSTHIQYNLLPHYDLWIAQGGKPKTVIILTTKTIVA